jgi:hypothetical protein
MRNARIFLFLALCCATRLVATPRQLRVENPKPRQTAKSPAQQSGRDQATKPKPRVSTKPAHSIPLPKARSHAATSVAGKTAPASSQASTSTTKPPIANKTVTTVAKAHSTPSPSIARYSAASPSNERRHSLNPATISGSASSHSPGTAAINGTTMNRRP